VHYPLLEHWGSLFGLAPLDVSATRLFSKICCLAGLRTHLTKRIESPAGLVKLGGGYVAMGDPTAIASKLGENKLAVIAQRKAGVPEMIGSALTLIGTRTSTDQASNRKSQYTALVLGDLVADQTVMLLVPVTP
jgi:hypothetical protein